MNNQIPERAIRRYDYLINLAGEGIAASRWTEKRKRAIISSRTAPNLLLAELFQKDPGNIKAYVSASGKDIYGDQGNEWCYEDDKIKEESFLQESVNAWESSIRAVKASPVRTVYFRTGMVLSTKGGALERMLPSMKVGLAFYFGNGKQYVSWIHIDDIARMYLSALENKDWEGVYNAVSSNPLPMKDFTKQLIKAHPGKQIAVSAPAFGLRLVFGEMADVLLFSNKVSNQKIKEAGFTFSYDQIDDAFNDLLKRKV
jgi:hypothetical protein